MKIRIKGNSLRYRLTKSDIDKFSQNGYLEEKIQFGEDVLVYALQQSPVSELSANFKNNKITLYMPSHAIVEWATNDRVGFEGNDGHLYLLVEKDFKCLDEVNEDQSDNYPNPHRK